MIASELGVDHERAEELKREVDLAIHSGSEELSGQTWLWREVQERHRLLAPAARICSDALKDFFTERVKSLRDLELLAQTGKVHLTGRAAALGGMVGLLRQVFDLQVVLGSSGQDREPTAELGNLMTLGLVRQAGLERGPALATQEQSGMRQVRKATTGFLAWLFKRMD